MRLAASKSKRQALCDEYMVEFYNENDQDVHRDIQKVITHKNPKGFITRLKKQLRFVVEMMNTDKTIFDEDIAILSLTSNSHNLLKIWDKDTWTPKFVANAFRADHIWTGHDRFKLKDYTTEFKSSEFSDDFVDKIGLEIYNIYQLELGEGYRVSMRYVVGIIEEITMNNNTPESDDIVELIVLNNY